jgi:predicted dehydrogenase
LVLDYPDATAIIEASWDWPYGMERVLVFGQKGSLLATGRELFYRPADTGGAKMALEGNEIALDPPARETSNPVAYFVNCVRHGKPTEEPLSGKMNVEVMEILDAARKSVRTGRQEKLR